MKKQILSILALAAVSLLLIASLAIADGCPMSGSTKATTTTAAVTEQVEGDKVVLKVSNMTCGACVGQVTKALTSVEGVKDVSVDLKEGKAEIICDGSKVKKETLTAAVIKAGYPAEEAKTVDATVKKSATGCAKTCGTAKKGCDPAACGMKPAVKKDGGSK